MRGARDYFGPSRTISTRFPFRTGLVFAIYQPGQQVLRFTRSNLRWRYVARQADVAKWTG